MGCSTEKEDQWDTASAILNILLKNPKEFEFLTKSSAIRESKLNSNNISLESMKCDDNSTYQNLSLVDQYGKHPEFPRPSFWHFRKTEETYRRFAGELLIAEPLLSGIKKMGMISIKHLLKVSSFTSFSFTRIYVHYSFTSGIFLRSGL